MCVLFSLRTQITRITSRKQLCEKGTKNEAELFLLLFLLTVSAVNTICLLEEILH